MTWDLGEVRPVSSFMLQADANDTYKIFGADVDTPSAYKLLVEIESVVNIGHGLRTRTGRRSTHPGPLPAHRRAAGRRRLLDLRVPGLLPRADAVSAQAAHRRRAGGQGGRGALVRSSTGSRTTPARASRWCWRCSAWRCSAGGSGWPEGRAARHYRKLRDGLLAPSAWSRSPATSTSACSTSANYIHPWDTFHYYAGSKYFNELSYDRLYECIAVADSEEPGLRRRVELRKVMNLRTNMMEGTQRDPGPPRGLQEPLHPGALAGRSRTTSPTSGPSTTSSAGRSCRPTTATTARRSGTSRARCWPTPARPRTIRSAS